ncbi:MAG: SUF system NifU family Fe-S cluster assembly protein [Puniceicoccales bacterium]|jgi:nitrogen fixation NifU-like protein|nr:SUF system NifU family Fe-S cluster assembly protein [Puniceicoccales bacterium]
MEEALEDLYRDVILEHNRVPRNKCRLPSPAKSAQGYNPSCGDDITVFVEIMDDIIQRITFDGEGCAISQASASLMTEILTGKSRQEAFKIIDDICSTLSNPTMGITLNNPLEQYGEVMSLMGVRKFPMRIKCATLAWHAAKEAIL